MASKQDRDRDAKDWGIFPSVTTRASYHSDSQHIELCEITISELSEALQNAEGNSQNAIRVLPLLYHEFRHWLDHIGTLWGLRKLISSYNAFNTRELDQETGFWRLIAHRKLVDRDVLSDYYTAMGNPEPTPGFPKQWMYTLTCGRRFDREGRIDPSKPIFFTQYWWADGSHACRVPFSILSLLEAGSMAFELEFEDVLTAGLTGDERMIEQMLIRKRRFSELYNIELGIYSTAVHLVANRMDLISTGDAYPLAGALASLCLNMPDHLFDDLRIPSEFELWGDNNQAAINQRDRGYLFMLLCFRARKNLVGEPIRWVENAAQRAGLPPLGDIGRLTLAAMEEARAEAIGGPFRNRLDHLIELGMRTQRELGVVFIFKKALEATRYLVMPPIVCLDLGVHGISPEFASQFEDWHSECARLGRQMSEFVAACGY